jgi:hypothetical protein
LIGVIKIAATTLGETGGKRRYAPPLNRDVGAH